MRWLLPQAVFDGDLLRRDTVVAVQDGNVAGLLPLADLAATCPLERLDGILSPGLVDIQVNGGGGVMLNNDPTPGGVRAIAAAHRLVGTAFTMPTVITDRPEITERAADAVLAEHGRNGVLGIHIEGPHISLAHKGTHDAAWLRSLDARTRDLLERLRRRNLPVLLTVAPEALEPGDIASLTAIGVIVSAGHSAATAEQTERALAEGLSGFTHLFNGMVQMSSRAPGIVAAAINSAAYCGIIADGHHVDDRMIGLAFRARPRRGRMILMSDAMSMIGGPDHFKIYGEVIRVRDGRLVNASNSLAGAHIDLRTSVVRLIRKVGIGVEDALFAATSAPRDLLALSRQVLAGSRLDDLCLLRIGPQDQPPAH